MNASHSDLGMLWILFILDFHCWIFTRPWEHIKKLRNSLMCGVCLVTQVLFPSFTAFCPLWLLTFTDWKRLILSTFPKLWAFSFCSVFSVYTFIMSFVFWSVELIMLFHKYDSTMVCTWWGQSVRNPLCWVSNKLSNDDQHFFYLSISVFLCFSLTSHRTSVLRKQFSVISGSFFES